MADLHYREGHWGLNHIHRQWEYYPPGMFELGVAQDPKTVLESDVVRQLMAALDEAGWIVPRLDERLRAEDLKITHRLLDLLEQKVDNGYTTREEK